MGLTKLFNFPGWVTPALAFNNTTSLPLLLVQSLNATGILSSILMGPDDSSSEAVNRAKSYFLVNAMVSNSLTFALGPRLLNGQNEDSPSSSSSDNEGEPDSDDEGDAEDQNGNTDDNDLAAADEQTSLMPDIVQRHGRRAHRKARRHGRRALANMPPWVQSTLDFVYQFINAPLIGAIIGGIIGLVPPLHTLFFANPFEGGYFKAWLTSAVQNVGDLFAALQVIVVGVKLAQSLRSMKAGEESGDLPWGAFGLITLARYILWPLISIPIIWLFATRTTLLGSDPVLWFTLMLMPAGPPAMKLTALADVNGTDEKGKMSIAKFLTVSSTRIHYPSRFTCIRLAFGAVTDSGYFDQASYTISPLIAFSVVASLKAAEAAMKK